MLPKISCFVSIINSSPPLPILPFLFSVTFYITQLQCSSLQRSILPSAMVDTHKDGEKPQAMMIEYADELEKPTERKDYSGAHSKTDPREIALVKKLDRWIMVSQYRQ